MPRALLSLPCSQTAGPRIEISGFGTQAATDLAEAIDLAAALTWAPPKCAPLMEAPLLAQALKDLGDLLGR